MLSIQSALVYYLSSSLAFNYIFGIILELNNIHMSKFDKIKSQFNNLSLLLLSPKNLKYDNILKSFWDISLCSVHNSIV